jgi:membrane-associated phospholipid phosphatase
MIEEIDNAPEVVGNNLSHIGDESGSNKSPLSYEPPKVKEPLLARIISIILHPFFMGVYGVSLLFLYTDFRLIFAGQFMRFITPVFFLTCVIPASSIYFLRKAGLIKDYDLKSRNDRLIPYVVAFCSYCLLIYYFVSAGLYAWFIGALSAPLVLIVIAAITTKYWKISAYMMVIGGLIGCTLSVCYNVKGLNPFILFIILFILAGCLGVSRLMLQRHTPGQVYTGFLVGLIVSYLCVLIGAYWGVIMFIKNL